MNFVNWGGPFYSAINPSPCTCHNLNRIHIPHYVVNYYADHHHQADSLESRFCPTQHVLRRRCVPYAPIILDFEVWCVFSDDLADKNLELRGVLNGVDAISSRVFFSKTDELCGSPADQGEQGGCGV